MRIDEGRTANLRTSQQSLSQPPAAAGGPYPSSQAQKETLTTPSAVVMVMVEEASAWPTPKWLASSQALTPVGTEEVSTMAAVHSGLRPSSRQAT